MTFPATPLPIGVELYYSSAWHDITPDVYSRDSIVITRGRSDEGKNVDPSTMRCTLDNRNGTYSPRNPSGSLYGLIGRNTPIRSYVELGEPRSVQPTGADYFSCPDSAGLSITGDIDLRVDLDPPSWRPSTSCYIGLLKNTSYGLYIDSSGYLVLYWSTTGVNTLTAASSIPIPGPTVGRKAVRVTLDVDNGAAGRTATFYYSDTIAGTWTQFGTAVTTAGTTSIFDSATALTSLCSTALGSTEVFALEVRQGIAGTVRANPTFTSQTNKTTSFSDGTNTWTTNGSVNLWNRHYRFTGEVTSWPQKWDVSGTDVYTPIECSGITRRMGQGSSPTRSAMYRGISAIGSGLVAYWPMEDAVGSASMAPAKGTRVMRIIGAPTLAADDSIRASAALPTLGSGRFVADVEPYTNSNSIQVRFLATIPAGTPNNAILARVYTNNSLGWWDLIYTTASSGSLSLQPYTNLGVATSAIGAVAFGLNDQDVRIDMEATKNGAGIDFTLVALVVGAGSASTGTVNVASATLGSCTQVDINPASAALGSMVVGHLTVEKTITTVFDLQSQSLAYFGEASATRLSRLATENSLTLNVVGAGAGSELLGYQTQADVLTLLRECGTADGGILYEPRDAYALAYRTVESLYSQSAGLSIAYTDYNLQSFEPVDDDQATRNKVTVTRLNGTSSTVEDSTSAMGTAAPPTGAGLYDDAVSLSLYADVAAKHQAGWKVHLGTVNEARYPTIGINLAHPDYAGSSTTLRQVLSMDLGDRLAVTGMPAWLAPEAVSQLVQGATERFSQFEYSITFNCAPASPYRAALWGETADRYSNDGTTLAGTMTTTSTSRTVNIATGSGLWTTTAGDFPFDIMVAGERMTVTNITGSSSPQTFTVTRSVNGVVKAQASGAAVTLFDPIYYGL